MTTYEEQTSERSDDLFRLYLIVSCAYVPVINFPERLRRAAMFDFILFLPSYLCGVWVHRRWSI